VGERDKMQDDKSRALVSGIGMRILEIGEGGLLEIQEEDRGATTQTTREKGVRGSSDWRANEEQGGKKYLEEGTEVGRKNR